MSTQGLEPQAATYEHNLQPTGGPLQFNTPAAPTSVTYNPTIILSDGETLAIPPATATATRAKLCYHEGRDKVLKPNKFAETLEEAAARKAVFPAEDWDASKLEREIDRLK
jgi:hypothetical protein